MANWLAWRAGPGAWSAVLGACLLVAATQTGAAPQPVPPRDRPAQEDSPTATGVVAGRVAAADTGRPVRRARVVVRGEGRSGRAVLTDEAGRYEAASLPEGRYTVTATKSGYVTLTYGQRRPLQAGIPLTLQARQRLNAIDFALPRGSVITGHILDEGGEPLTGASVQALQAVYQQGQRQFRPTGSDVTDDRGVYRIFGLMPGTYLVNARPAGEGFRPGGGRGRWARGEAGIIDEEDEADVGYAPTYHPGTASPADAVAVPLGLGEEVAVDFAIELVPLARVSGRLGVASGSALRSGMVGLGPETTSAGRGSTFSARVGPDGVFAMTRVPPGRYRVVASGQAGDAATPLYAYATLTVAGADIDGLVLVLQPGAELSGLVVADGVSLAAPLDLASLRVLVRGEDGGGFGAGASGQVDERGRFTVSGISAGTRALRLVGLPRGWTVRSVRVGGREVADLPLVFQGTGRIDNVAIVVTDLESRVEGLVEDEAGRPTAIYTVVVFPDEPEAWSPLSRRIATARPDQNGRYEVRGLPRGRYFVVAVDDVEEGEWFDPGFLDTIAGEATRITLVDGGAATERLRGVATPRR